MKTETINTIITQLHENIKTQLNITSDPFIINERPIDPAKKHLIATFLLNLADYPLEACTTDGFVYTINGYCRWFTADAIQKIESNTELLVLIESYRSFLLDVLAAFPLLAEPAPMFTPAPNDIFCDSFTAMLKRLHLLKRDYTIDSINTSEPSLTKTCNVITRDAITSITPKMYILSEPTEFERDVDSIVGEDVSQYGHDLYTGSVPAIRENHWLNSPNAELYAGYLRSFTIETIAGLHNDIRKAAPNEPAQSSIGTFTLLITLIPRTKLEAAFNHASTLTSHAELMDFKEWLRGLIPTIK